ncbi:MAG TPA: 4'-phosphopantetheinyl transferase superfamily protein [Thermoanaerobaculia bacterium]|nr:4'-phosphopantetheinyl transferase superfamily protein [Thermoanaerobaculia bacterium]
MRTGFLLADLGEVPEGSDWLTPDESGVCEGLRLPGRRDDWRLGRWTAKRAVALWLGEDPAHPLFAVRPSPEGAPEVFRDGARVPVAISFGHRAGRAACAVAPEGTALGCDLELIEPRSAAFLQDFFTPAECNLVAAAPEADRPLIANLIWSAKESALKALRTGLRLDTWEVEVTLGNGACRGWRELAVHRAVTGETFRGWWRREGDWVVTVAAAPAPEAPVALS